MSHLFAQGDAARIPLADASCDLVIGSPPYLMARLYLEDGRDLGISRNADAWVDWMLDVTEEALRVTKGAVIWVCAGVTRDRNYQPACEGLLWEAHKRGWLAECPVYWHRVGIPGSGGDQWFRKDVEYCLCFKRSAKLPWSDNTACGHAPKYAPGGAVSHRRGDGSRVEGKAGGYTPPKLANPGSLLQTKAGGGHLGDKLAHLNEAPFPEAVPEFFIKSLCRPGGIVLNPFSGSGTTVATAARLGRCGIGFDLRASQCRLGVRRIAGAAVVKASPHRPMPLFEEGRAS